LWVPYPAAPLSLRRKTHLCFMHIATPVGGRECRFLPLEFAKPPGRLTHIFYPVKFLQVNYTSSNLFCERGLRKVWGRRVLPRLP